MTNRFIRTALLSAALLLTAIPFAANAAETRSVAVRSADLNLATEAGRAGLQHRIAHAVDAVCGSAHGRTTEEVQSYAACSRQAQASATSQFDTLVAAAKSGRKVAAGPASSVQ